jgi:hypothetical protein
MSWHGISAFPLACANRREDLTGAFILVERHAGLIRRPPSAVSVSWSGDDMWAATHVLHTYLSGPRMYSGHSCSRLEVLTVVAAGV